MFSCWLVSMKLSYQEQDWTYITILCTITRSVWVHISGRKHSGLVESTTGDLWHVLRSRSQKQLKADSQRFKVFKVELIETGLGDLLMQQVEVKSIGDDALFIGYNSVSVLASQTSGCQPNSIYYSIVCAVGMFNLDDETSSHITWPYDSKPTFCVTPPFDSAS